MATIDEHEKRLREHERQIAGLRQAIGDLRAELRTAGIETAHEVRAMTDSAARHVDEAVRPLGAKVAEIAGKVDQIHAQNENQTRLLVEVAEARGELRGRAAREETDRKDRRLTIEEEKVRQNEVAVLSDARVKRITAIAALLGIFATLAGVVVTALVSQH